MRILRPFLLFIILLPGLFSATAQNIFFEKTFGTPNTDLARSVKQLPDGTIYVAGFSNSGPYGGFDVSLSRLDRFGNLQWTKYYGDSYDNNCLYMNLCSDGNLVLTGEDQGTPTGIDAFALKVDTAGNQIWREAYASPVNESSKYIEETLDGGFIMCGFRNDAFGSNDAYVIKTDASGNMQWDQAYGAMDNEYADMIRQLPEGGYLLTADTKSMGAGGYDVYVLKLDSAGNSLWDYTYGDQWQNGCQGIFVTSGGKYLSYGETEVYQFSPFQFYLELIDTNGTSIWRRTFGGSAADAAFSLVEAPDGGFMATGYSNSYNTNPGPLNLIVFKTDPAGYFQWARSYGSEGIDLGYEIIHSIDNGYLVTGKIYIENSDEYYLLHLDQEGTNSVMESAQAGDMLIYPNPARDRIIISSAVLTGPSVLNIYSANGRLALQKRLTNTDNQIDTGQLFPGTYIVELRSENSTCRQKLVIVPE